MLIDDDSEQLVLKHLKASKNNPADVEVRLITATYKVKNTNNLIISSSLRAVIFCILGLSVISIPYNYGLVFIFIVAFLCHIYDYYVARENNAQFKKIIELNIDIDEKQHVLKLLNTRLKEQNELLNEKVFIINQFETIKEEKHRVQSNLSDITSYNNHLANIIRGVNHEVSPWIGSIGNIAAMAKEEFIDRIVDDVSTDSDKEIIKYLDEIRKAARQASDVLVLTSKNVKKLRNWSTTKSNVLDTIRSWGYIALMEQDIKGRLNEQNMIIDHKSLNFEAFHSPMLVSQIILNLVKNSIDHNGHFLDDLKVTIHGNGNNTLYVEDNGKGIPHNEIDNIFQIGVSTKKDSHLPTGLGLANTIDYCMLMGAVISVESKVGKYTKFGIRFATGDTETTKRIKETDNIQSRSAYYEIIKDTSGDQIAENYKEETPSYTSIEISNVSNPATEFRLRMSEIDETLKKLR